MLKAELKYPDGSGGYNTIAVPNVISIEIDNESLTGFSFWQVEGGTAKLSCVMFPELQAVIEQTVTNYFECEFRIYEGTSVESNLFLGYLKRGNYQFGDNESISVTDCVITMTLHNPLKVIIDDLPNYEDEIVPTQPNTLYDVQFFINWSINTAISTLTSTPYLFRTFLYDRIIAVSDRYNALLTNPTSVTGLELFNENNFAIPNDNVGYASMIGYSPQCDYRQFKVETIGTQDFYTYYRNRTLYSYESTGTDINGRLTRNYFGYSAIRSYKWEILGSSFVPVTTQQYTHDSQQAAGFTRYYDTFTQTYEWIMTNGGITLDSFLWEYTLANAIAYYPPIDTPSSSGIYALTGDSRTLDVDDAVPMRAIYTGRAGYDTVMIPKRLSIIDLWRGLMRANLASLVCAYDTIIISNKIVDTVSPVSISNGIMAHPSVKSNPYTNDIVKPSDLPFGNTQPEGFYDDNPVAVTMANGINDYFRSVIKLQLPYEISFEVDLNPLTDELTQTLELGKVYGFAQFYVYVTDIKTDYVYRTAKIKGLGKLYGN